MKSGFSKLSKKKKIDWVIENFLHNSVEAKRLLEQYHLSDSELQKIHDDFSENTLSNFLLPLGVAPNFLIDGKDYIIPMVVEESSVVAAACNAAKFWYKRGGFKTKIIDTKKSGQVHFLFDGNKKDLFKFFVEIKSKLISSCDKITANMKKRGGGIVSVSLLDKTELIKNYYHISAEFETADSMGANFINSCMEQISKVFEIEFNSGPIFNHNNLEIIMSILSNYTPNCKVKAEVECEIDDLIDKEIKDSSLFANKFKTAIEIAEKDKLRAVTHNKGIMNGVDSVVIATGNDFRAVEACAHSYASKDGNYKSLTHIKIIGNKFKYWIELPISIGTVGGLTNLHPLVKWSLKLLGNPNSKELMKIIAVSGLAQNFAAIKSLITTGIQKGHMKMHLSNILNALDADDNEKSQLIEFFNEKLVSHSLVKDKLKKIRNG
ncbi:MAG: hydroxymethylglutaryl-CoA reductase, degradative [Cryomorphaceae bacterium]|nr:MAG: hydroxymethylglutaryl-CoA reductase, degradative [Cryomorphaceae bacterium]